MVVTPSHLLKLLYHDCGRFSSVKVAQKSNEKFGKSAILTKLAPQRMPAARQKERRASALPLI